MEPKRVFKAKEMRSLLSLAPSTSLSDAKAVRDNFENTNHGEYTLKKGISLDLLIETCRAKSLERKRQREGKKA